MNKNIITAIIIGFVVVSAAVFYSGDRTATTEINPPITAVIDASDKQIIDIAARGGYSPRLVVAKAGIETIIRVVTKDTYDCSVSLVIPKLEYRKFLTSNGTEDIIVPAEKAKGTLNGLCSMGMYSFKVVFQ